jgi:Tfp pilus assembly protein PilN
MAGFSLGGAQAATGVNFIAVKPDKVSSGLKTSLLVGLVLTALVVVFLLGSSAYLASVKQELVEVNSQIDSTVKNLQASAGVETEYLLVQSKLDLYSTINENEKMADLFPKITAIVPDGIRLQDMTIQPQKVTISCVAENLMAVTQFNNNLLQADGTTFDDGQVLTMTDISFPDVSNDTNRRAGDTLGYNITVTFNYSIK